MKRIVILGSGRQGRTAGEFLIKRGIDITIVDINKDNLKEAEKNGFKAISSDLSKRENIVEVLKTCNIAISALPAYLGRNAELAAIEARRNLIDLTYLKEEPLELYKKAKEREIVIIPDAGVAPGLSSLIAGYLYSYFDQLNYLKVLVGGIPKENIPPLGYTITWSPEDLIAEYSRSARIKKDGKILEVPALSGIEEIHWEGMNNLEAFYTDGLRTLLKTFKDVENMEEKTIRYSGHAKKIKFLFDIGYFSDKCNGTSPRKVSLCLLKRLSKLPIKDIVLLRVIGRGRKDGKNEEVIYEVFDRADEKHSAMERTTGYTCAMFAYLLLKGEIDKFGVLPPETLGMDEMLFKESLSLLHEEGIELVRK